MNKETFEQAYIQGDWEALENFYDESISIIERLANTNHDIEDLSEIIIESQNFLKFLENEQIHKPSSI